MIKAQEGSIPGTSQSEVKVEQNDLKLQWNKTEFNVKVEEDSSFERNIYVANAMEKVWMLEINKSQVVKMEDESIIERIQSDAKAGSNQQSLNLIQNEATVKVEEDEFPRPDQIRPKSNYIQMIKIGKNESFLELIKSEAIVKTQDDGFDEKMKINSNSGKKKIRKRRENWRPDQNLRYLNFISHPRRRVELEAVLKKEKQRIFNHMSAKIQSRTSRQCKSHHQKMLLKHGTVEEIIRGLTREDTVEKDMRKGLSRIALKCKQQP